MNVLFLSNVVLCIVVVKMHEIVVIECFTLQIFCFMPFDCYYVIDSFIF
jgi:hypothetical protein